MELVPWRPFGRELGTLRSEMDDLWSRFFGEMPFGRRRAEEWSPSVDLSETKDNFAVKAELPGLEAKDIDVSLSGDVLTIKGEKKKEEEEKDEQHHYVERFYGSFQRSFQLRTSVQSDEIEASFDKGVLSMESKGSKTSTLKSLKVWRETHGNTRENIVWVFDPGHHAISGWSMVNLRIEDCGDVCPETSR